MSCTLPGLLVADQAGQFELPGRGIEMLYLIDAVEGIEARRLDHFGVGEGRSKPSRIE